jgi:hypothetical protein
MGWLVLIAGASWVAALCAEPRTNELPSIKPAPTLVKPILRHVPASESKSPETRGVDTPLIWKGPAEGTGLQPGAPPAEAPRATGRTTAAPAASAASGEGTRDAGRKSPAEIQPEEDPKSWADELVLHARRLAIVRRLAELTDVSPGPRWSARVGAVRAAENARHGRWLERHPEAKGAAAEEVSCCN